MSVEAELTRTPYLLTFGGPVTLYFLDGLTLEGEIAAQDDFNLFLKVDDAPVLVPRTQIRYIKGAVGQPIVEAVSFKEQAAVPLLPPTPPPAAVSTQPMSGLLPPLPEPEPSPAPPASEAEFAEIEEDYDELGGTLIIPPVSAPTFPPPDIAATELHQPVNLPELTDSGETFILKPEAQKLPEILTQTQDTPSPALAVDEPEATAILNALDFEAETDEDVTFVLQSLTEVEPAAHLVCTAGPHAGEVYTLKHGVTTIGRSSDNTVPLSKDKEISRRHSIITYEASKYVVTDQNSLNGTYVNDRLIKGPQPLEDGDLILVGVSTLKYQER
jgi:pSer/pThr/pTyr-binding forkhead associated (FHA) protein